MIMGIWRRCRSSSNVTQRSTTPNFPQRQAGGQVQQTHMDKLSGSTLNFTSRARDQQRPAAFTRTSSNPVALLFAFTNRTGEQVCAVTSLRNIHTLAPKICYKRMGGDPGPGRAATQQILQAEETVSTPPRRRRVPLHVWMGLFAWNNLDGLEKCWGICERKTLF